MLVRNSRNLRMSILQNVRMAYITTITPYYNDLGKYTAVLCRTGIDKILTDMIGESSLKELKALQIYNIVPKTQKAVLNLLGPATDYSKIWKPPSASNPDGLYFYEVLNANVQVPNFGEIGFLTQYTIKQRFGNYLKLLYFNEGVKGCIHINISLETWSIYTYEEQVFLSPLKELLEKINLEYKHYVSIIDYFKKLFDELPSLNQMYKVCPTILKYVSASDVDRLYMNIAERKDDKLLSLKPPPDVSVALGRNKLRSQ